MLSLDSLHARYEDFETNVFPFTEKLWEPGRQKQYLKPGRQDDWELPHWQTGEGQLLSWSLKDIDQIKLLFNL